MAGCASDLVLPDRTVEPECGNGTVEAGEQCDVDSEGCVECVLVPGFTCSHGGCAPACGDGVVGGAGCSDPRRDSDCDMTGWWAVRETDYTRDTVVNALQTSSTWYLYRIEQADDAFMVTDEIECGVRVTGSVTVEDTPGTLRALTWANRMDAKSAHGPRKGTSKAVEGGCALTLDRWYKIRGAKDTLLPADFSAKPSLSSLTPLPSVEDPVEGTTYPDTAEDTDGDGVPGISFRLSGFVHGVRNTAQRDWKEYASFAGAPVPKGALAVTVPGTFDLQEKVLHVSDCGGLCPLVASPAAPARDVVPRITFAFVGKTLGSPRVASVVAGVPRVDLETDLTSCAKVRLMLPHDTSTPIPAPATSGSTGP